MESISESRLLKYIIQESYPKSWEFLSSAQINDIVINGKVMKNIEIIFENGFVITISPVKTINVGFLYPGQRFESWEEILDEKYLPINILETILFNLNEFRKL